MGGPKGQSGQLWKIWQMLGFVSVLSSLLQVAVLAYKGNIFHSKKPIHITDLRVVPILQCHSYFTSAFPMTDYCAICGMLFLLQMLSY